jgi:hypothetical protein
LVCLVTKVNYPNVSKMKKKTISWKKYAFYGLLDEFGLFSLCELAECDEVR